MPARSERIAVPYIHPGGVEADYKADIARPYAEGLASASTLARLRAFVARYGELTADAQAVVAGMEQPAFREWRAGLQQERANVFAGHAFNERYGALLMPKVLMAITLLAARWGVPEGAALNRLCQLGGVVRRDGRLVITPAGRRMI